MKLKIDHHYLHPSQGVLKYRGSEAGRLLFHSYESFSNGRITQSSGLHEMDPSHAVLLRPCPPPR